nr:MAG TPA: hypothetical protein [Bacteriophage sp.]
MLPIRFRTLCLIKKIFSITIPLGLRDSAKGRVPFFLSEKEVMKNGR